MVSSLMLLALLSALVFTTRSGPRAHATRNARGGRPTAARAAPPSSRGGDTKARDRGNVSFRLVEERRPPSRWTRLWRRVRRLVAGPSVPRVRRGEPPATLTRFDDARPESGGGGEAGTGSGEAQRPQSSELRNFLDARRAEIARRKAEGTKRGPDDKLH